MAFMTAGRNRESQLRNLLSCTNIARTPTLRRIRSWTPEQRQEAKRWATAFYLRSIGFDIIHPPEPMPDFLDDR